MLDKFKPFESDSHVFNIAITVSLKISSSAVAEDKKNNRGPHWQQEEEGLNTLKESKGFQFTAQRCFGFSPATRL